MSNRRTIAITLSLIALLILVLAVSTIQAEAPPSAPPAPIRLKTGTFIPEKTVLPEIASAAEADQVGVYLIQFAGPVRASLQAQVQATGAELLEYIPEYAYKVRMTAAQAQAVDDLDSVGWVGLFRPAYKLSPDLKHGDNQLYTVQVEGGADVDVVAKAISALGVTALTADGNILTILTSYAQIKAIARIDDVAWIENFLLREKHNEYGGGVILGANSAHANGYDGSSQIVAVADTGLGDGTAAGAHPAIPAERVKKIFSWGGGNVDQCIRVITDGAIDPDSGHGTHVSTSILGSGDANGMGKGVAPGAQLVFQAIEDYVDWYGYCEEGTDGYYLIGLPSYIRNLFQQAYNAGARVHANSWGAAVAGDYTVDSKATDEMIWERPDLTITFSAGNAGIDADGDGVIDADSIGSPATAKNVISVGASENERGDAYPCDASLTYIDPRSGTSCADLNGVNYLKTYNESWPEDFPADPIASDPSAGDAEQMAAFSSRGPTDDGRIKPDVVAPGTWLLSGYSDLYQEGYDESPNTKNDAWQYDGWGFPPDSHYKYMGGTSMSNPLVAGAAAVVRDYYWKAHNHQASAALVKATLINSAVDLLDENNDGVRDNAYPIPNIHEGWGRVDVAAATAGRQQFFDALYSFQGLNTGQEAVFTYDILQAGQPFKASLVWSDYPAAANASKSLVNDLDLIVQSPTGEIYEGNNFAGGWSQPTAGGRNAQAAAQTADRINNVENVYVQNAALGTWTVTVRAFNVPEGPQRYALVIGGAFEPAPTATPTPTSTPTPTATPQPPACARYDFNSDGIIDLDDINAVLFNSIFVGAPYNARYDLIADGVIDIADIAEVAAHIGEICP